MRTAASTMALVCGLAAAPAAQDWFDLPRYYTEDELGSRSFRSVGDFDNDGYADAIAYSKGDFQAWGNDGGGGLEPGPVIPYPSIDGVAVIPPKVGDVDGDGNLDVILTRRGAPDEAALLFRGDGSLGFEPVDVFPLGGNPFAVAVGDSDGDGRDEIAVAHYHKTFGDQRVRWLHWSGGGLVTSGAAVVGAFGYSPISLAAFDYTGDGRDDLALGTWSHDDVALLRSVGGSPVPDGHLAVPFATGIGRYLASGDLDGDGDDDLLVHDLDDDIGMRIVVYENQGGGGPPSPGIPQVFTPGSIFDYSQVLHLGDWDGDGDLDAAHHWRDTLLFQNFADQLGFTHFQMSAGPETFGDEEGAGMADFDGDGDLDFAGSLTVQFGDGTFHPVATGVPVPTHLLLDVEDDGDLDAASEYGELALNDGTGAFTSLGALVPAPANPAQRIDYFAAVGDLNGDGFVDFLAAIEETQGVYPFLEVFFVEMRLYAGTADGAVVDAGAATPEGVQIPPVFGNGLRRPVGDLDGDGDPDLTGPSRAWINDGAGFFTALDDPWAGRPELLVDVDGDDDLDVLVTADGAGQRALVLYRNQGALAFTPHILFVGDVTDIVWDSVIAADTDGDGDPDLVASGPRLFENLGGVFGPVLELPSLSTQTTRPAMAEDVDADGDVDLVTHSPFVQVYLRGADGSFDEPLGFLFNSAFRWEDLDGDGDRDGVEISSWFRTRRHHGDGAGLIRQYGAGKPGTGGAVPVLGARGPVRVGEEVEIRLRRGLGGAAGIFVTGVAEAALPGFPLPSITLYTNPVLTLAGFSSTGPAGVAGAGELDIPWSPAPGTEGGGFFSQVFLVDPGASGFLSHTGGLELRIGE